MFYCEEEHHFTFSPHLTAISTAAGQVKKIINRNASLVLFRGPGHMGRRAGFGPRAVVWGPLMSTNTYYLRIEKWKQHEITDDFLGQFEANITEKNWNSSKGRFYSILSKGSEYVIFQFFFFNKFAKMSTYLFFSVKMGYWVLMRNKISFFYFSKWLQWNKE